MTNSMHKSARTSKTIGRLRCASSWIRVTGGQSTHLSRRLLQPQPAQQRWGSCCCCHALSPTVSPPTTPTATLRCTQSCSRSLVFFCIIFVWVQEAFLDEIEVQPLSIIERAEKEAAAARRAAAAAAEYAKNAFSAAQAAKSGTAKPKDKPVAVEPKTTVPKPLIKPTPTSKPAALPASQPTGTAVPLHTSMQSHP